MHARGQRVTQEDASDLSSSLLRGLSSVSDAEVPMSGKPFGEEHTRALIAAAVEGETPGAEGSLAAAEILSGSPKTAARDVADFMSKGAFSIRAEARAG